MSDVDFGTFDHDVGSTQDPAESVFQKTVSAERGMGEPLGRDRMAQRVEDGLSVRTE